MSQMSKVPKTFAVKPLRKGQKAEDHATCNTCGRSWDDAIVTAYTPAPAARCPFEAWHAEETTHWHMGIQIIGSRGNWWVEGRSQYRTLAAAKAGIREWCETNIDESEHES